MSASRATLEVLFQRLHKDQLSFVARIIQDAKAEFAAYHETLTREERRKVLL